jgi:hypothetical protein
LIARRFRSSPNVEVAPENRMFVRHPSIYIGFCFVGTAIQEQLHNISVPFDS